MHRSEKKIRITQKNHEMPGRAGIAIGEVILFCGIQHSPFSDIARNGNQGSF
jgi:hypothetical protein